MSRGLITLCCTVLVLGACSARRVPVEQAYTASDEAYAKAASPEEKARIVAAFLAEYPESEHTSEAVATITYLLDDRLHRPSEADRILVKTAKRIADAKLRREVLLARVPLLGELGRTQDLADVIAEATKIAPLRFADELAVARAEAAAGSWELSLQYAQAAAARATEAAFRADNAARNPSDDIVARGVAGRTVDAYGAQGWALANLDRFADATSAFDRAAGSETFQFTGESTRGLAALRGRALVLAGQDREALDMLAPEALFGNDEKAREAMRIAYVRLGGTDEGFADYLWSTRLAIARPVPDFTLSDYANEQRSFSTLRNGEVALLAFWFPT